MNTCRGFVGLKQWQIAQYIAAVNENKWYLSEGVGRDVGWAVAEADFLNNGFYGCADRWRKHHCAHICKYSLICELAKHFAHN